MGKRKAISKKMRFEVFKRDNANKKTLNHFVYDYLQNESNFEEMKKILKNSRNWTAFRDEVEWRFW